MAAMRMGTTPYEFDVFVSYRWAEPDQSWVRRDLVPALENAGLKVCLDVNDFVPGRDLILEMSRAGQSSRRLLCVLSDDYFAGTRMVNFEALNARRMDVAGLDSRLVPLIFRPTVLPEWLRSLIPVDWTDHSGRAREWRKLLRVLEAPRESPAPGSPALRAPMQASNPVFVHDYNLPHTFVARNGELSRLSALLTGEPARTRVVVITAIGGVGKSCLCRALIERPEIAAAFPRVVWSSFYEARDKSEDHFLREVLTQGFGSEDRDIPLEGARESARLRRTLSETLARERTLLVLDGLEVIQFTDDPESAKYGAIKPIWTEIEKLLRQILNGSSSVCLITSRVPLRPFETSRGYHHASLDLFTPSEGAKLLSSLGVEGPAARLEACAESLGGHALSLVAAGRFMARRQISAEKVGELMGDADVFKRTPEGEKVKRICEWYRSELSVAQQYFLTRLSLHGRSVTRVNYPVVVMDYHGPSTDRQVEEEIIEPLVERGLVDRFQSGDSTLRYSAHPLMKLAFSTWLEPEERKRAHEEWARAAAAAPGLFFDVAAAGTLEELQPLVDATEQYLAADHWREAWEIFSDRGLGNKLGLLGYLELALGLARQFEKVRSLSGDWDALDSVVLFDQLAWLSDRLGRTDDELSYRRLELEAARSGPISRLAEVESLVAVALASSGFVEEAAEINPSEVKAKGNIALAQGEYKRAARLLRRALKRAREHNWTVTAQPLAEALYRDGNHAEAAAILHDGLRLATEQGFTCCQRAILWHLTDLGLRSNDVSTAENWWGMHTALLRRLELEVDEHSWLLLAQGNADAALAAIETGRGSSPKLLIQRHIDRARVLLHLDNRAAAAAELAAAEQMQSESGYKQSKDDISQLLNQLAR